MGKSSHTDPGASRKEGGGSSAPAAGEHPLLGVLEKAPLRRNAGGWFCSRGGSRTAPTCRSDMRGFRRGEPVRPPDWPERTGEECRGRIYTAHEGRRKRQGHIYVGHICPTYGQNPIDEGYATPLTRGVKATPPREGLFNSPYFGGMTGKSTWEGCSGPVWTVTSPPNTSGGLSAGSLCRKGPTPEKTAGMLGSPRVTPPG